MVRFLGKWLKVYQEEVGLFLISALLLFLIRGSNVLFNNFAETAFLKRFGVQYLPIVIAVTSVSTFFIMGFLSGPISRIPADRMLASTLLFCGASVASFRFLIFLDLNLIYPVFYVMKAMYEVLLGLCFWNLANDLFNTRQSKRLFPLITSGGLTGGIIGSFGTPFLVKAISFDNLLIAYLFSTWGAALVARRIGVLYPIELFPKGKKGKKRTAPGAVFKELKKLLPIISESKLVKILILLTFLPNIVIPILNYQFNFAVNEAYKTEGGMVGFFGYFRGVQNIIALVLSLFSGRVYARFGMPVALMFHPFNYMLAFFAFLLRFNIFSAMYARLSTAVLRNTINMPAMAVLQGLFPPSYRARVRPFLRGTVVRVAVLLGSGLILLMQDLGPPRYLSLVALPFVAAWIGTTFMFKRSYPGILLDLLSKSMIDLKSFEGDASQIFREPRAVSQLVQHFLKARGEAAIWYGKLLRSLGAKGLDAHILSKLKEEDDQTRIELLALLSPQAGREAAETFLSLVDPSKPDLMVAFARTAKRVYRNMPLDEQREIFEKARNPEVKAYALIGFYNFDPQQSESRIKAWLNSAHLEERRAGVLAAGESGNRDHVGILEAMLEKEEDPSIIPLILVALGRLEAQDLASRLLPYLSHPVKAVRLAALEGLELERDEQVWGVIRLVADPSDRVRGLAIKKLQTAHYQKGQLFVEALLIPNRRLREGIFEVIQSLNLKEVDVFHFINGQLKAAYGHLARAEAVRRLPECPERDLLALHLDQQKMLRLEDILRVMAVRDSSGRMRMVLRGLDSSSPSQKSNSLEALENLIDPSLSRLVLPLMENLSVSDSLAIGKKHFKLPDFDSAGVSLFPDLLGKQENWVTVVLALDLLAKIRGVQVEHQTVESLTESGNKVIRQMARWVFLGEIQGKDAERPVRESLVNIPKKIRYLKDIQLLRGLTVSELGAVSLVTREAVFSSGQTVIQEGDIWDKLYMVVEGEVSVREETGAGASIERGRIGAGEGVGDIALFTEIPPTISVHALSETHFLILEKEAFEAVLKAYPMIAIQVCRELARRLRMFQENAMAEALQTAVTPTLT
jgi:HEAT repeat protein